MYFLLDNGLYKLFTMDWSVFILPLLIRYRIVVKYKFINLMLQTFRQSVYFNIKGIL